MGSSVFRKGIPEGGGNPKGKRRGGKTKLGFEFHERRRTFGWFLESKRLPARISWRSCVWEVLLALLISSSWRLDAILPSLLHPHEGIGNAVSFPLSIPFFGPVIRVYGSVGRREQTPGGYQRCHWDSYPRFAEHQTTGSGGGSRFSDKFGNSPNNRP
jgi:hypothetical protein